MKTASGTMKQTSVRFGRDLWALLEHEAALVGVSVSQYIREAALARATAAAAVRGDEPFELLAGAGRPENDGAATARGTALGARSAARAVQGQSKQARSMAKQALSRSEALRKQIERTEES